MHQLRGPMARVMRTWYLDAAGTQHPHAAGCVHIMANGYGLQRVVPKGLGELGAWALLEAKPNSGTQERQLASEGKRANAAWGAAAA